MNPTEEQIEKAFEAIRFLPDWDAYTSEQARNHTLRKMAKASLSSMPEQPQVQIVRWDDADMSELIIRDGPHFVGQPVNVYPVYDMESKELIGFRWYGEMGSSSMPEQEGWRTMDSAPKDGTRVDIWAKPHDAFEVGNACRWADCEYVYGGWRTNRNAKLEDFWTPTHWRPRPPPPLPAQEDDRG